MTRLVLVLAAVLALSACASRDARVWRDYSAGVGQIVNRP